MDKGVIKLKEALEIMRRRDIKGEPVPFDITYKTFSAISKKGGKHKTIQGATYLPPANPDSETEINILNVLDPVRAKRNPNHYKNRTRNLQLPNKDVRTIHIDFIISINNLTVIY